jgi:hypothetical protein
MQTAVCISIQTTITKNKCHANQIAEHAGAPRENGIFPYKFDVLPLNFDC